MAKRIEHVLTDFRVYKDGEDYLGMATVELPDLEAVTAEVKGAGIAGVADIPVDGHYSAMTLKLNWNTANAKQTALAAPIFHQLDIRGNIQAYDPGSAEHVHEAMKVVVKCKPKNTNLGKTEPGSAMDSANEFEVIYIKITQAGEETVEIDKFNYKCVIHGVDYLDEVRANLGI